MASIPYGDDREASTSEEEAATYNAPMEREAEVDQFYRRMMEAASEDTWCDINFVNFD